jgi:hypothetical protein
MKGGWSGKRIGARRAEVSPNPKPPVVVVAPAVADDEALRRPCGAAEVAAHAHRRGVAQARRFDRRSLVGRAAAAELARAVVASTHALGVAADRAAGA